jgi:putative transposase
MKIHRSIEGTIKTCAISKSPTGKWFASFSCEVDIKPLPKSTESTGIDVGLHSFAALSSGEIISNPRFFHEYEKRLAKSQRLMEKQSKGSSERSKKRKVVSHIHEKILNHRSDFVHKKSREIVDSYGMIFLEDLPIRKMGEYKQYSKSIHDVAWGMFRSFVSYKAEWAGRIVKSVNPAFTSQTCSYCESRNHEFVGRMFRCLDCDNFIDRDHNAAINIERLGLQSLGLKKIREAPAFRQREQSLLRFIGRRPR